MADEQKTTETVVPADTETVEDNQTPAISAEDYESVKAALKKANAEAAERRKQLKAYETAEQERKEAEMSEQEKLKAKLAEVEARAKAAEAQMSTMRKQTALYAAVEAKGLSWASEQARRDAVALLDLSELDDDGMEDAIKALQTDRPYLFKATTTHDIDGKKRGKETPEQKQKADSEEAIKRAAHKFGVKLD
ncbi:MAG TPA: hypothetical protein VM537_22440 [Anaerolineae bacterium]|nr:hypothetical protein [Anaerolineae bacterium]